ncbi:MAG: tRNA pseudouridine(38-40) synthase TruA [Planctomycetes bacterium]|nr:tRNA pseudouridine(38-40) synthase TruA [Planctomycetota bacterium]
MAGQVPEAARSDGSRRFRVTLAYCGTAYHGWQAQDGVPTVEGALRAALSKLSRGPVETAGASRTDTGVHAWGQCCLCTLETTLDEPALLRALQSWTPRDISIRRVQEVDDFHPRFDALEKRYLYRVANGASRPIFAPDLRWWVDRPLDESRMNRATAALIGTHDFAAFRNVSKDEVVSTVRTIRRAEWVRHQERLEFQVIGDGFLYRMVRNLVGSMVEVGRGKRDLEWLAEVRDGGDRTRAGPTAPAEGLFLMEVRYPDDPELDIDRREFHPESR